jgi:hypothetical protein
MFGKEPSSRQILPPPADDTVGQAIGHTVGRAVGHPREQERLEQKTQVKKRSSHAARAAVAALVGAKRDNTGGETTPHFDHPNLDPNLDPNFGNDPSQSSSFGIVPNRKSKLDRNLCEGLDAVSKVLGAVSKGPGAVSKAPRPASSSLLPRNMAEAYR